MHGQIPHLSQIPGDPWQVSLVAIWLLAEFCVHRNSNFCFRIAIMLFRSRALLAPDP